VKDRDDRLRRAAEIYGAAYGPAYQAMRDEQRKRAPDPLQHEDRMFWCGVTIIVLAIASPFLALWLLP
jgi:hypothetical protein